jgi:hypothetical protein
LVTVEIREQRRVALESRVHRIQGVVLIEPRLTAPVTTSPSSATTSSVDMAPAAIA